MKKTGITGLGNMGYAIHHFLKEQHELLVYDPYKAQEKSFGEIKFAPDLKSIAENCKTVILAVKPDKIEETVTGIESVRGGHNFISIAAGIRYETIKQLISKDSRIVRLMPNLPLTIGKGVTGYYGDSDLYAEVNNLFGNMGLMTELGQEKLMDPFTALAGSGPAFVFSFIQALAEGGVKSGLAYSEALKISIATVIGSAELLKNELETDKSIHPYTLRNRVTSPGGTTIFGLAEMEKGGFQNAVMNAVYAATEKSKELGK